VTGRGRERSRGRRGEHLDVGEQLGEGDGVGLAELRHVSVAPARGQVGQAGQPQDLLRAASGRAGAGRRAAEGAAHLLDCGQLGLQTSVLPPQLRLARPSRSRTKLPSTRTQEPAGGREGEGLGGGGGTARRLHFSASWAASLATARGDTPDPVGGRRIRSARGGRPTAGADERARRADIGGWPVVRGVAPGRAAGRLEAEASIALLSTRCSDVLPLPLASARRRLGSSAGALCRAMNLWLAVLPRPDAAASRAVGEAPAQACSAAAKLSAASPAFSAACTAAFDEVGAAICTACSAI
jgi:hypothetical protein